MGSNGSQFHERKFRPTLAAMVKLAAHLARRGTAPVARPGPGLVAPLQPVVYTSIELVTPDDAYHLRLLAIGTSFGNTGVADNITIRRDSVTPTDLVIDHSVRTDFSGTADALSRNLSAELERNRERFGIENVPRAHYSNRELDSCASWAEVSQRRGPTKTVEQLAIERVEGDVALRAAVSLAHVHARDGNARRDRHGDHLNRHRHTGRAEHGQEDAVQHAHQPHQDPDRDAHGQPDQQAGQQIMADFQVHSGDLSDKRKMQHRLRVQLKHWVRQRG